MEVWISVAVGKGATLEEWTERYFGTWWCISGSTAYPSHSCWQMRQPRVSALFDVRLFGRHVALAGRGQFCSRPTVSFVGWITRVECRLNTGGSGLCTAEKAECGEGSAFSCVIFLFNSVCVRSCYHVVACMLRGIESSRI